MRIAGLLPLAVVGAAWFAVAPAHADTLRCGNSLVEIGATADTVHKLCGEPDSIERETKTFRNGGRLGENGFHGTVSIEKWIYDRGPTCFKAVLTMVEGELEFIAYAGVGRQPAWSLGCTF